MTRSNKELELAAGAAAGGGDAVDAVDDDPPKSDMMSSLADREGAPGVGAEATVSMLLDPKMSAKRSCVDGPEEVA